MKYGIQSTPSAPEPLGAPDDDVRHARLSVEDLTEIALAWRIEALRGDPTARAVAAALESVVRRRMAMAATRERVLNPRRAFEPLRRATRWALSRR